MEMGAYGNDDKHVDADNEDGKDGIAETEAHVVDYAISVASAVEFINQNVNPLRENIADHHGIVPVLDGEEGATTVDVLDVLHNTVGNGEGVENYNQHGGGEKLEGITLETSKSGFAKFKIPKTPVKILKGLSEEGVKKKVGGTEVVLSDEDSDDSDAFSPEILDSDYEVVSVGDNKSSVEPGLGGGRELASNHGRPITYGGAMTSSKRDVYTPFQKWEYENGLPVDSIIYVEKWAVQVGLANEGGEDEQQQKKQKTSQVVEPPKYAGSSGRIYILSAPDSETPSDDSKLSDIEDDEDVKRKEKGKKKCGQD